MCPNRNGAPASLVRSARPAGKGPPCRGPTTLRRPCATSGRPGTPPSTSKAMAVCSIPGRWSTRDASFPTSSGPSAWPPSRRARARSPSSSISRGWATRRRPPGRRVQRRALLRDRLRRGRRVVAAVLRKTCPGPQPAPTRATTWPSRSPSSSGGSPRGRPGKPRESASESKDRGVSSVSGRRRRRVCRAGRAMPQTVRIADPTRRIDGRGPHGRLGFFPQPTRRIVLATGAVSLLAAPGAVISIVDLLS
jgi:hypothetical protein